VNVTTNEGGVFFRIVNINILEFLALHNNINSCSRMPQIHSHEEPTPSSSTLGDHSVKHD